MTELILKPQNSTDWLYSVNGDFVEYIADGNNFGSYAYPNALNVTPAFYLTTEQVISFVLQTNSPNGTWQGYYQTTQGSSNVPTIAGQSRNDTGLGLVGYSGIELCSPSLDLAGGNNGIYQQVYGLTVGSNYSLDFNYLTSGSIHASSEVTISVYDTSNGVNLIESEVMTSFSTGSGSYDMPFTATNSELTIVINFWSQLPECLTITSVGLTETWETVSYSLSDFTDGSVSLDLFEEAIPLTLSVSEFTNAVDNVQSYSKDFRLPSTKTNDRVFSHIYNLDSSIEGDYNAFNPYVKTIATIKEDNIEIFTGELTLNSIDKGSEGIIYNVHLQSIVTGLASVLKGRTFDSLNFSELNHDFTSVNIRNSWTDNLQLQYDLESDSLANDQGSLDRTSVIKYPFVNWTGNILDNNNNGELNLANLEQVYRPWMSVKYILDKIFKASGFGYDSVFLNSTDFTNLYMDFNHGGENGASAGSSGDDIRADWNASSTEWLTQSYSKVKLSESATGSGFDVSLTDDLFDYANGTIQPLVDNTSMRVVTQVMLYNDTNTFKNIDARLVKETFAGVKTTLAYEKIKILGSPLSDPHGTFSASVNVTLNLGDKVYVEARTHSSSSNIVRQGISGDNDATWIKILHYGSDAVRFESILSESRGKIKQWDFIKSLMNMFNLLIMPTENPNRFIIEPYNVIFDVNAAAQKDWTNRIDEDTFKIKMQDLDRQVDFSFTKDDDDYISKIYSEETTNPDGTSYNYGDLKYLSDDYTALTSESKVDVTPFASTIIKPLNDYSGLTDLTVPCIYKKEDENSFKVYKNKPRLLYNNGVKSFSGTYDSPSQNGQNGFISEDEYLQFSHFSDFDNVNGASSTALDYNFRNCPSLVVNATINGLFNEFWSTYYDEKYHPDTRIYDVQALLTPNDIFNFEYTDIIRIKTQEFRVNSIQYNPKGMSKINLIKLP